VNVSALLQFIVGATHTSNGPVDAPVGTLMLIDVALQLFTVAALAFSKTTLPPLCAPNPEPDITTCVPMPPDVGDILVIDGAGAVGVLIETLSKEAVATAELLLALTANPMYTFCAMLIVCVVPTCAQFTPSAEIYPLKLLPILTSFTQYGSACIAALVYEVLAPVLNRS